MPPDPSSQPGTPDPSKPRCTAHTGGGKPCQRWPVDGANVCATHGGRAPQVKAAAKRRLELQAAERAVVTFGLPREVDPHEALLEEVHRTAGAVEWLRAQVQALDPAVLTWGRTEQVDKGSGEFPGTDVTYTAVPPVLLELYLRERKHLVEVCRVAIAAGVEERRVRLAEETGREMAALFHRVLDAIDLSEDQRALVPALLAQEVQALMEGKVSDGRAR